MVKLDLQCLDLENVESDRSWFQFQLSRTEKKSVMPPDSEAHSGLGWRANAEAHRDAWGPAEEVYQRTPDVSTLCYLFNN